MKLIAKTSFGMEDLLVQELESLGAQKITKGIRMVSFEGDKVLMYRVNLWSRVALRILMPIASFRAGNERQLYDGIKKQNWNKYMAAEDTLAVDAVVNHSVMTHSLYVAQKTKDAIVDRFREDTGKRPSVDLSTPTLRIHVHISGEDAEVSLDSSGDSLHKRGYRTQTGDAPINESLAAGLILLSGWDKNSPFTDLMCGSGTIVIEAALMAINRAPGLLRKQFGFERWRDFDAAAWRMLKNEAKEKENTKIPFPVTGVDHTFFSIRNAKQNAEAAGVAPFIRYLQMSFDEYKPETTGGTVLMNPPYGGRITTDDLPALYKRIGDEFKKKYKGCNAFIFTANKEAAKHIGLKPARKIPLFNGKLECRLLKFELYEGSRKFPKHSQESSEGS